MKKSLEFNTLFEKAKDFYDRQEFIIALDYINNALSLDSVISQKGKFEALFLRGEIKIRLDKFKGSIYDFNKAIELAPSSAESFFNRGSKFFQFRFIKNTSWLIFISS